MPDTSGLSFYLSIDPTSKSITYGFDVLSADDITVIAIASGGAKTVLKLEPDTTGTEVGYGYTVNLDTKTVTMTAAAWTDHPLVYATSSIRVYRTTTVLPLVNFQSGAVLSEGDLDISYKQGLFAAQEMTEDAADTSAGIQSVTTGAITYGAVTVDKLAANSVSEAKILANSVSTTKIQNSAVTSGKIATGSIGSTELSSSCVIEAKIAAGAVTSTRLAEHSVGYREIANGEAGIIKDSIETQLASSPITPDVLKYSPFSPRCYGVVGFSAAPDPPNANDFSASYNVASISEPLEGQRTITFTTALDSVAYVVIATIGGTVASNNTITVVSKATTGFTLEPYVNDASGLSINFVVFGSKLSA